MLKRILRNTFLLSVSHLASRAIGFLYTLILARSLGVENFGIFTFTLAFAYNFIPVADFGIERLILRDIPREPKKISSYFPRLLTLRVLLFVAAFFLMILLAFAMGLGANKIFLLSILGASLLPYTLIYLIVSFDNAREKMESMSVANITTIGLTMILGVLFLYFKLPLYWIISAYFYGNLIVLVGFLAKSKKEGLNLEFIFDKQFFKDVLRQVWVFAFLLILSIFYLRLSILFVGFLESEHQTGIYGSAFRFIEALIILPQSLAMALFPLSSRLFSENKQKLIRLYFRALMILIVGVIPVIFITLYFAKLLIGFTYGVNYLEAVPVLSVLSLALIFFYPNTIAGNIVLNSSKLKYFLPVVLLHIIILSILCLFLIPQYSILGAAWAVVGAEASALLINNIFIWRILKT